MILIFKLIFKLCRFGTERRIMINDVKNGTIVFYDRQDNEQYNTTSLYYMASKEFIKDEMLDYKNAGAIAICIEFPTSNPTASYAALMISPVYMGEIGEWNIISFELDVVNELIMLGMNNSKRNTLCRIGTKILKRISEQYKNIMCRLGTRKDSEVHGTIYCNNE